MSYSDGEALILAQIQKTDYFDTSNSSRYNWNVLNKSAQQYAILQPGAFKHSSLGAGGSYQTVWTTVCEIWVPLKEYSRDMETLVDVRQAVIERFDAYRHAGDTTGTIQDVSVISGSEPVEMGKRGRTSHIKQNLIIQWTEESVITLQE